MLPQTYLPKAYCWEGWTLQCAVEIRDQVDAFMAGHPKMRVYSALRSHELSGDHRCGLAVDIVPLHFDDEVTARAAYTDAVKLRNLGKVAYVEPFPDTWLPGNHHVHISFRRCSPTLLSRTVALVARLRRGGRRPA